MGSPEKPPKTSEEGIAYALKLHRAASQRQATCRDAELAAVLGHVSARRNARCSSADLHLSAGVAESGLRVAGQPAVRKGGPGALLEIESVAADVRIFRVGRPASFVFEAGQAVKVGLPGQGKGHTYSLASAPHEAHLEFCIERVVGGRLTPALFALTPGAQLEVGGAPKGSMRLDPAAAVHLMVATVTGIAPLRSMLRDALHRRVQTSFVIIHGASYAVELPYRRELEALAAENPHIQYRPTISRPDGSRSWSGSMGRADEVAIGEIGSFDPKRTRVYACGHGGMVTHVREVFGSRGFGVTTEAFT